MEKRAFKFEIRAADASTGKIAGHLAVFNVPIPANRLWHGMDEVTDPGAFTKTLQESRGVIPFLKAHDTNQQLGLTTSMGEDSYGLAFEATLLVNDVLMAREEMALIEMHHLAGKPRGVSIGFQALDERIVTMPHKTDERHLLTIALYEGSSVAIPAQELATITEMRSVVARWDDRGIIKEEHKARVQGIIESAAARKVRPDYSHLIAELKRIAS